MRRRANTNTGMIDAPTSTPWAISSIRGSDHTQYSGASKATKGWK